MVKKITQLFSFYGAKHRAAYRYPEPTHKTIKEPFAGSAGYAHLHWDKEIILNDADPVIATVWEFLINASPSDILALPLLKIGQKLSDIKTLSNGERWLIGFWTGRARWVPGNALSGWGKTHSDTRIWSDRCRARIAEQIDKISHWKIYNMDYAVFGEMFPTPATWFIDPPYQEKGKHYKFGSSRLDYPKLGAWCMEREGQAIVCENPNASWLPFESLFTTKGVRKLKKGKNKKSKEGIFVHP